MSLMKKYLSLLLILVALSIGSGCALEEGLRAGVVDGSSTALSALIQAPVTALIDATFPGSGG